MFDFAKHNRDYIKPNTAGTGDQLSAVSDTGY